MGTIFLTGATGFIGGHVLKALVSEGARVRCMVRRSSSRRNLEGLSVEEVEADLRAPDALREAMRGCDTVFHCAADYRLYARDPRELYDTNVEGTRNVMRIAAESGVRRVVYTSSVGTLGLHEDGTPADETTPVTLADMVGHYKRSKFLAERVADEWVAKGLPVVIVNPSAPVGDGDLKPTATGKLILDFLKRRIPGYVDTGLNLVDVRDVAQGHLLAAQKGQVGERYILGNRNMTLQEIFQALGEISGLPAPKWEIPHWLPMGVAAVETLFCKLTGFEPGVPLESVKLSRYKMYFDGSKAVRELGMPQTPVPEALRRAVDWFRENNYVSRK